MAMAQKPRKSKSSSGEFDPSAPPPSYEDLENMIYPSLTPLQAATNELQFLSLPKEDDSSNKVRSKQMSNSKSKTTIIPPLKQLEQQSSSSSSEAISSTSSSDAMLSSSMSSSSASWTTVSSSTASRFSSSSSRAISEVSVDYIESIPEARVILINYLQNATWFKKKKLDDMTILSVTPEHAYTYTLTTFAENRWLLEAFEPFDHGHVDGQRNHMNPSRWSVEVDPPDDYNNANTELDLPHSSLVKPCGDCQGIGNTKCRICKGVGIVRCSTCEGEGNVEKQDDRGNTYMAVCKLCNQVGRISCYQQGCNLGQVQCRTCVGQGKLKHWKVIKIKWEREVDSFTTRRGKLKLKQLRKVTGNVVVDKTILSKHQKLAPIIWSNDEEITCEATRCVQDQRRRESKSRKILMMNQEVKLIPVAKVPYRNEKSNSIGYFFIYGNERRVFFPPEFRYRFSENLCSVM